MFTRNLQIKLIFVLKMWRHFYFFLWNLKTNKNLQSVGFFVEWNSSRIVVWNGPESDSSIIILWI